MTSQSSPVTEWRGPYATHTPFYPHKGDGKSSIQIYAYGTKTYLELKNHTPFELPTFFWSTLPEGTHSLSSKMISKALEFELNILAERVSVIVQSLSTFDTDAFKHPMAEAILEERKALDSARAVILEKLKLGEGDIPVFLYKDPKPFMTSMDKFLFEHVILVPSLNINLSLKSLSVKPNFQEDGEILSEKNITKECFDLIEAYTKQLQSFKESLLTQKQNFSGHNRSNGSFDRILEEWNFALTAKETIYQQLQSELN